MPLTAELSASLCQTLYLCKIGGHTKVGSNVPLKSYININGLIGFLNIIFATGNTVASLGGYLPDTIGWRCYYSTVYRRNVLFTPIAGLFVITGTRYDHRDNFSFSGITSFQN